MCLRIVLWAILMGVAGGAAGFFAGSAIAPDDPLAPAHGLLLGAVLGSAVGAFAIRIFGRREPGD